MQSNAHKTQRYPGHLMRIPGWSSVSRHTYIGHLPAALRNVCWLRGASPLLSGVQGLPEPASPVVRWRPPLAPDLYTHISTVYVPWLRPSDPWRYPTQAHGRKIPPQRLKFKKGENDKCRNIRIMNHQKYIQRNTTFVVRHNRKTITTRHLYFYLAVYNWWQCTENNMTDTFIGRSHRYKYARRYRGSYMFPHTCYIARLNWDIQAFKRHVQCTALFKA